MKKLFVGMLVIVLATLSVIAFASDDHWRCKVPNEDIGRTDVTLSFAHSTVHVSSWIPKLDAEDEYVGFLLDVVGDPIVFTVKAGPDRFTSSGDSWMNPFGNSGPLARGISYIDFCNNEPPICDDERCTTTTTSTTTTLPIVTTTTTSTTTTTTNTTTSTTLPIETTTTSTTTSTTTTSTTSTTLPVCATIPILRDPAYVDWYKGKYFVHGRLIPLDPADYPLDSITITLETSEDGIWHTTTCPLTRTKRTRWLCKLPDIRGLVKVSRDVPSGKDSFSFRLKERGTFDIPSSKLITTTVYLLCSPGVNVAEWEGNLGDKIVNKLLKM